MRWSYKHHNLSPLHVYQLEVILLFIAGFFLFFPFYYFLERQGLDQNRWQWYFFVPWMAFFSLYSLYTRSKIPASDAVAPLRRPVIHWVLFGLTLVAIHLQPTSLEDMLALDISFSIFSVFMADSYWNFRKKKYE